MADTPKQETKLFYCGNALSNLNRYKEAEQAFEKARQLRYRNL